MNTENDNLLQKAAETMRKARAEVAFNLVDEMRRQLNPNAGICKCESLAEEIEEFLR